MFSMGVVMYQLMTDRVPDEERGVLGFFQGGCNSVADLEEAVQTRAPQYNQMQIKDPMFVQLVQHCLAKARRDRMKAPQALHNPWLEAGSGIMDFDSGDKDALLVYLSNVILNPHDLKLKARNVFNALASQQRGINVAQLAEFKKRMEGGLHLPNIPINNFNDAFDRFDFNGDKLLDFHELWKLLRELLAAQLSTVGGDRELNVPWKTPAQGGYTTVKVLKSGGQGSALLATDAYGAECVLKSYLKNAVEPGGMESLKDEMGAMQTLGGHTGIAHCFEIFQDQQYFYMSGYFYRGGDLTALRKNAIAKQVNMTEMWWQKIFYQCFNALTYMHKKALMHCDIKEDNLMVKKDVHVLPEIVIIDLGMAAAMRVKDKGLCGTPGYIPPEVYTEGKWFPRGDVFSMGVVMLQLVSDMVPDIDNGVFGIFQQGCEDMKQLAVAALTREPSMDRLEIKTPAFVALLRQCLAKDRTHRPRAPVVLENSWIALGSM